VRDDGRGSPSKWVYVLAIGGIGLEELLLRGWLSIYIFPERSSRALAGEGLRASKG
jgi:hypothetical protein